MNNPGRSKLSILIACITLLAVSCCDNESPTNSSTPKPIGHHTVTLENAYYISYTGKGFVNLYDGFTYSDQNATAHASKIDSRHQNRGTDIGNRRIFENTTSTGRLDFSSLPYLSKSGGNRSGQRGYPLRGRRLWHGSQDHRRRGRVETADDRNKQEPRRHVVRGFSNGVGVWRRGNHPQIDRRRRYVEHPA